MNNNTLASSTRVSYGTAVTHHVRSLLNGRSVDMMGVIAPDESFVWVCTPRKGWVRVNKVEDILPSDEWCYIGYTTRVAPAPEFVGEQWADDRNPVWVASRKFTLAVGDRLSRTAYELVGG